MDISVIVSAGVSLLIAGVGGAIGYGLLRGQVRAQDANLTRHELELAKLHERSNHNRKGISEAEAKAAADLAAAQLAVTQELAAIKACITRIEAKLDNHIRMHEQGFYSCGGRRDDD